jgi:hypothetical protein
MIISELQGGLGNQLFQYAAARYLSVKQNHRDIFFHSFFYSYVKNRSFLLDRFNTIGKIGAFTDYPSFFPATLPLVGKLYFEIYRSLASKKWKFYTEVGDFQFDQKLSQQKGNIFLKGFWQTALYAEEIRPILQKELTLKEGLPDKAQRYLKDIQNSNSVSLHVRRGDYVNNPQFPACDLSYYHQAIEYVQSKIKDPHFFIFSDDQAWVQENFQNFENKTFVTQAGEEVDEFGLLSKTKHTIIANSTFSWWAAWLATSDKQIVVAPYPWRTGKENAEELYLKKWIRLPRSEKK